MLKINLKYLLTFVHQYIMIIEHPKERRLRMSPRTGRPTDNPKPFERKVRLSDGDIQRLEYTAKVLGLTKAEVIRQGIDRMYQEAQKQAKK